jgi:hypothetical protein
MIDKDLAALVWIIRRVRPAWDERGLRAVLAPALAVHEFARVAAAAIDAAATPTTRTPAGIGERLRNGWAGSSLAEHPRRDMTATAAPFDRDWFGRQVHNRASDEARAAALTRARSALRALKSVDQLTPPNRDEPACTERTET